MMAEDGKGFFMEGSEELFEENAGTSQPTPLTKEELQQMLAEKIRRKNASFKVGGGLEDEPSAPGYIQYF